MEQVNNQSPLQWPAGWHREHEPKRSRFGTTSYPTIANASRKITYEMGLFGGKELIISTNLKYRQDGLPYSSQKQPEDKGVAVYFNFEGSQKVIACDSFDLIGCNLWAIAKTIEAMRGINRWGCSQIISKAFTGFTALPEKASTSNVKSCWYILDIDVNSDIEAIKRAYKRLAKEYHPDSPTGSNEKFQSLNNAFKDAVGFKK